MAAEGLERYFSDWGDPPQKCEVYPKLGSKPAVPELERNPDNTEVYKAAGFLSAKE